MKLSHRWLGEMVDLEGTTPEQIQDLLTFHTAEVEDTEAFGGELDGVVTARVTAVRPHPDADKLRLCSVQAGERSETVEVVCGAPNVAEGQIIAYAPVGITLPGGPDGPITLEKRKIRGVESCGMICSERELGLGEDHDGILVLPADTPLGTPFADAMELRDTIYEIANVCITHRPDLWGHVGFARELGALLHSKPDFPQGADPDALPTEGTPFPITIEDEPGCRRYVGIVLEDLTNGPSPLALRRRLELLGMRSVDLLVDLTNLVLLEQGQPMHAFDLRDLRGGEIHVRAAGEGEIMRTLDGQDRVLNPQDLVIADGEGPVALAGVMGAENSEVRADTKAILLESATFDPVRVRRTAARLGLRTEASSRFEKTLDPELAWQAALRFVALVQEHMPGARVSLPASDCYPRPFAALELVLPYALVRRRLGCKIPDHRVRAVLNALGFEAVEAGDTTRVKVPSWRASKDVARAEDLVEEVGRIYGYDKLTALAPIAPVVPRRPRPVRVLERATAAALSLELGYAEVKHRSFYGAKEATLVGLERSDHLRVRNPSSEDHELMIRTTAAQLLRTMARNQRRTPAGRVWEIARVFAARAEGLPLERPVVALGSWDREDPDEPAGAQFLGLMGDIRTWLERLGLDATQLEIENGAAAPLEDGLPAPEWLHPGRRAVLRIGGQMLGHAGEVAPAIVRAAHLEGRCCLAELDVGVLLACRDAAAARYEPILRYPLVPFDVAVIVPRKTPAGDIRRAMREAVPASIRNVHVFDVYEGSKIPAGFRSIALRCELFDRERTLDGSAADALRSEVVGAIEDRGWTVRKV